jgi:Domain of unknown function (DUF5666)
MPQLTRLLMLSSVLRTSLSTTMILAAASLLIGGCIRANASASSGPLSSGQAAASAVDTSPPVPTTGRVSGTVREMAGARVVLTDGTQFELAPDSRIIRSVPGSTTDLRAGQFVAITALRQPDDTLLASRVNVFAESQRGLAVGQRPMTSGNLMTNATIDDGAIDAVGEGQFSVSFPDGHDRVQLAPDVQIEVRTEGSLADLQPGAEVTAVVTDGVVQSLSVQLTDRTTG